MISTKGEGSPGKGPPSGEESPKQGRLPKEGKSKTRQTRRYCQEEKENKGFLAEAGETLGEGGFQVGEAEEEIENGRD